MKRALVTITLFLASTSVFAQKDTKKDLRADTPMKACQSIVKHAVDKDFEAVKALSLRPEMPKKKMQEKGFNKMHEKYMADLKDLNCVREMIADDHAVVETESEGGKRLIPFVKQNENWKFDTSAYMAFYDTKEYKEKKRK